MAPELATTLTPPSRPTTRPQEVATVAERPHGTGSSAKSGQPHSRRAPRCRSHIRIATPMTISQAAWQRNLRHELHSVVLAVTGRHGAHALSRTLCNSCLRFLACCLADRHRCSLFVYATGIVVPVGLCGWPDFADRARPMRPFRHSRHFLRPV